MKYSIIIAERNETENLKQTIANIQQTQRGDIEIIAISDTSGKGPQFCRNEGIRRAKNDIMIITDAHMRFKPGALDQQAEYMKRNPNHITCLRCHHNDKMSFQDGTYMAARFVWKSQERNQFWILHGKWRKHNTTGEVPCVMGACYGLSKANYVEKLKSPLRFGKGWGMDEELLCITNWLCGGKTVLLDLECAHLYRVQKDVPYQLTTENVIGVWANRLAMLAMLPMSENDASELRQWLDLNEDVRNFKRNILGLVDLDGMAEQLTWYKAQERSFEQWKEIFITEGDEDMKRKKNMSSAPRTMERPPPVPAGTEKRTYTTNRIVKDNGIPCLHCQAKYDHKVTNTYPNGNRRMVCSACGLPFIAVRAV